MIYRKRRTSKQRSSLRYKQRCAIGIGETREQRKRRKEREEAAVVSAVHDEVFSTRATCQLCDGRRRGDCMGLPDQMHEDPSRAQTRGRPPEERFNLVICGRLCAACHRDVTEEKIVVMFEDRTLGWLGRVWSEAA